MLKWLPIADAPKDGRPVWVRGHDYGDRCRRYHMVWAHHEDGVWREARADGVSTLDYLTEFCPDPWMTPPPAATTPTAAQVALKLLHVLRWPMPYDQTLSKHLPARMVLDCRDLVRGIPQSDLEAEIARNPDTYPGGILDGLHE